MNEDLSSDIHNLFDDIRGLIESSKQHLAAEVNATMSLLYWDIGKHIANRVLGNQKPKYGLQIMTNLSRQLTEYYGKGWSEKQLRHCLYTVENFPERANFSTLCAKLSWSHFKELIYIKEPLKREFYMQMCIHEKWSVRVFRDRIKSMLYERTAISKNPEQTIKMDLKLLENEQKLNTDLVFRDPYFLDFLGLSDTYSEKDLEVAILVELQQFIIELGSDFAFLARQKRLIIDNRDYRIDLLFYHRRLKSLVAIDLKIGEFEAGFKGQMELYLNYLQKHETVEGEKSPIGLILCAGKNSEHIELMQLGSSNIKVAQYLTLLPSQKVLKEKLHRAIEIANNKVNSRLEND